MPSARAARVLGCLGLLPFPALSLLTMVMPERTSALALHALQLYALGILCFLCGAWWGIGLMRQIPLPLLASNAAFLVILAAYLLADGAALLLALSLAFVALWVCEGRLAAFSPQPPYYRRLRAALSLVAALCLLLTAVSL